MHRNRTWSVDATKTVLRTQRNRILPIEGGDGSTLSLDFTSGVLDPRLTFTRTSNATFINSQGYVELAGQNVLVQTANMTLWTAPTNIDTTVWGSKDDPFGGTTAVRLTPTGTVTAAAHYLQSATVSSSTLGNGLRTVYSVYAKAATSRYRILGMVVDNGNAQGSFVLSGAGEGTATAHLGTNVTVSMTAVGNGWYRCVMTWPSTTMSASCWCAVLQNNTTVPSGQTFVAQSDDVTGGHGIFVYGAQWEQGSTPHSFIPTTSVAKSDVPRFDHDPTTQAPKGLLIESAATNIATNSNLQAAWLGGSNTTVTANTNEVTSPDGTNNAAKIALTNTGYCSRFESITGLANATTYTFSYWIRGTAGNQQRVYSVTQGTDLVTQSNLTYTSTGWTRVQITFTSGAASNNVYIYVASRPTGTVNDVLYVYGCQLEAGNGASSLIPTGASTVQRLADNCAIVSPNFAPWFNASAGTLLVSARTATRYVDSAGFDFPAVLTLDSNNQIGPCQWNGVVYGVVRAGGSYRINYATLASPGNNANYKAAIAYADSDYAGVANGGSIQTGSGTTVPSGLNQLALGASRSGVAGNFFGHISQIKFWPTRLPNAQLQALTT